MCTCATSPQPIIPWFPFGGLNPEGTVVASNRAERRSRRAEVAGASKASARDAFDDAALRRCQATQSALQAAGAGVWECPTGDGHTFWSEQMYRLRGLDPADPRPVAELARLVTDPADLESARRMQRELVECGRPYVHEFRVQWPDGSEHWLLSRAQVSRDGEGVAVAVAGVDFDVTAQRRVDTAPRARNPFVTCMNHELRTPLNAVLGFGQLLLEDPQDPPTPHQKARLQHIERAARHMLALINQTLDLSSAEARRHEGSAQPVALADCAREAMGWLEPVARKHDVTVREERIDGSVIADAGSLKQVVANLVGNAVKYNRPGGWVVVRAARRVHQGVAQCALVVRDSGRGLTRSQVDHLFEPFNRLGAEREGIEGTGLGLSIARQLVQRMGGQIEVESEAGVGTEFRVWLPVANS